MAKQQVRQGAALQLALTACFILWDRTKPSRQRNYIVYHWKTPERQLKDSIRVIYGINFEMFLTSYISAACQGWHSDISSQMGEFVSYKECLNSLHISLYVKSLKKMYCADTSCCNLHSSADPDFLLENYRYICYKIISAASITYESSAGA